MTIRDTFFQSFRAAMPKWRGAGIVYFVQILLALTLGLQVFGVIESSIGTSLELEKLLKNYDHTVVTDFLNVHGASITPLIGQLRWLILVYLIFAIFLDAGLLASVFESKNEADFESKQASKKGSWRADWRSFWTNGATWFFPFLKIAGVFLSLFLIWSAVIWLPILTFLRPALDFFYSEATIVWGVFLVAAIWLFGLAVLFGWSVLSRIWKMKTDAPIRKCLAAGGRLFWAKKGRVLGLLGLFAALHFVIFGGYLLVESWGGMTSSGWIFGFFVLQQAFVFFRIQLRQMVYAALSTTLKNEQIER